MGDFVRIAMLKNSTSTSDMLDKLNKDKAKAPKSHSVDLHDIEEETVPTPEPKTPTPSMNNVLNNILRPGNSKKNTPT